MNRIDKPIERLGKRRTRTRKLTALWDAASFKRAERALPPAVTLIPWHLDERGCWARTVGNET